MPLPIPNIIGALIVAIILGWLSFSITHPQPEINIAQNTNESFKATGNLTQDLKIIKERNPNALDNFIDFITGGVSGVAKVIAEGIVAIIVWLVKFIDPTFDMPIWIGYVIIGVLIIILILSQLGNAYIWGQNIAMLALAVSVGGIVIYFVLKFLHLI